MKPSRGISLVILTSDRPELLGAALESVCRQTQKPDEVIVVDGSMRRRRETAGVIRRFRAIFPITVRNTKGSIPAGRLLGAHASHGNIVVYLDDDCRAEPAFLKNIAAHFRTAPDLIAVMGMITNGVPGNPFARCQYAYYRRGLMRFFPDLTTVQPVTWGRILDCEVMGIQKKILLSYGFPDRHRRYRNDDVELGLRIRSNSGGLLFDPRIRAAATPRTTFLPLLSAAFWNGYSDASTERLTGTNMRTAPHRSSFIRWYMQEIAHPWNTDIGIRLLYALLLILFPAISRTGRLWYILTSHENRDRQRYA